MANGTPDLGIGEYAKTLLSKGPKQKRGTQDSKAQPPKALSIAPAGKKFYHPAVYDKISQHIGERLKKLGG